jgi:hypothetical protein
MNSNVIKNPQIENLLMFVSKVKAISKQFNNVNRIEKIADIILRASKFSKEISLSSALLDD